MKYNLSVSYMSRITSHKNSVKKKDNLLAENYQYIYFLLNLTLKWKIL